MAKEIDIKTAKTLLPERIQDSNKSTYGKILNIAGSKFYQGAAYLSSISALKSGAGYVMLACPDCILDNIASKSADITFLPLRSFKNESIASDNDSIILEKIKEFDIIAMGCGLSTTSSTIEFVGKFLQKNKSDKPLIIDADGLNAISALGINKLNKNCIITPHPKELSRLLEVELKDINENREKFALKASEKFGCITLLKGLNTLITDGNEIFINKTGCSGLAKAGSGDVLTGIIAGLCAQKVPLVEAAALGAYIHGLLADMAKEDFSEYSILASDLINYVPKVIKKILNQ